MKCDLLFSKSHIVFVVAKITRFTTNPQDEELNEPEGGSMRLTSSELLKNIIQQYDARLNTKNMVRKMLLSRHKGQRNIEAIQHNATKRMYAQPTKLLSDDTPTKPDFEATAASEAFLNPLKLMVTPRRSGWRLFGFLIGKRWKMQGVASLKWPQASLDFLLGLSGVVYAHVISCTFDEVRTRIS